MLTIWDPFTIAWLFRTVPVHVCCINSTYQFMYLFMIICRDSVGVLLINCVFHPSVKMNLQTIVSALWLKLVFVVPHVGVIKSQGYPLLTGSTERHCGFYPWCAWDFLIRLQHHKSSSHLKKKEMHLVLSGCGIPQSDVGIWKGAQMGLRVLSNLFAFHQISALFFTLWRLSCGHLYLAM